MTRFKIGPSEQAILDWLKIYGPATAFLVGESLHTKVTGTPEWMGVMLSRSRYYHARYTWAHGLLSTLYLKGRVAKSDISGVQCSAWDSRTRFLWVCVDKV